MRKILVASGLVAGLIQAQTAGTPEPPKLGSISGTVMEDGTGTPVAEADVWVNRYTP